jgi:hypothetical protein
VVGDEVGGGTAAAVEQAVAFPAGTDELALARAWFPEAERAEEASVPRPQRLVGARFGGRAPQGAATATAGLLRVTWEAGLRGPVPRASVAAELPAALEDVYRVEAAVGDARLTSWLLAAARRAGGAVVDATGHVVAPPEDEFVGLTVYATDALPAELALTLARSVAPMMRPVGGATPESYGLVFETPYDGTVLLELSRSRELPVALLPLERDVYGRYALALTWVPAGPAAETHGSVVGRLARDRIVPLLDRLALTLQASTRGTVVDAGGFVVTPEELQRRVSR